MLKRSRMRWIKRWCERLCEALCCLDSSGCILDSLMSLLRSINAATSEVLMWVRQITSKEIPLSRPIFDMEFLGIWCEAWDRFRSPIRLEIWKETLKPLDRLFFFSYKQRSSSSSSFSSSFKETKLPNSSIPPTKIPLYKPLFYQFVMLYTAQDAHFTA